MATSSSDLKTGKKRKSNTVVKRLARAAKEAAAKKKKDLAPKDTEEEEEEEDHLLSIADLNRVIDDELLHPRDGYRPPRETTSMRILLEHNENTHDMKDSKKVPEICNVAIVFAKPLWQDQITIEYVSRIVSLARAMKYEDYKPALICFCGATETTKDNLVAETSAGVIFFRHLCAANDISLENTNLCIIQQDRHAWSSHIVEELLEHKYLKHWLEQSEVFESNKDEYGFTRQQPRKKIHIHWTLISTDYHLCNLNDIHVRSPGQSPFNTLLQELDQGARSYKGIVKTTWCFRYSTYPYIYSKNELSTFLGNCYLMAQELWPLHTNLKGVARGVSRTCSRRCYAAV